MTHRLTTIEPLPANPFRATEFDLRADGVIEFGSTRVTLTPLTDAGRAWFRFKYGEASSVEYLKSAWGDLNSEIEQNALSVEVL